MILFLGKVGRRQHLVFHSRRAGNTFREKSRPVRRSGAQADHRQDIGTLLFFRQRLFKFSDNDKLSLVLELFYESNR